MAPSVAGSVTSPAEEGVTCGEWGKVSSTQCVDAGSCSAPAALILIRGEGSVFFFFSNSSLYYIVVCTVKILYCKEKKNTVASRECFQELWCQVKKFSRNIFAVT